MLLKGNGICHGITGSSYGLHSLYRATGNHLWLQRSYRMALATAEEEIQTLCRHYRDPGRLVKGICDTPYSLMEGIGGNISLYCDLLDQESVRIPGYEILY
jgi:hypothetical protein